VNRIGLPLLVLLSVCACSRDPQPEQGESAGNAARTNAAASGDSVAAVAQGGATGPVSLRFAVETRPVVGTASSLRLELAAAAPLTGVSVRIEGETLGFDAAGSQKVIDLPEAGKPVVYAVRFTPETQGIADASVHVLPAGAEAREVVYAIPVLVEAAGNPGAAASAPK